MSNMKKLTLFDALLLDYDIELKEALAIRKYEALEESERDAIKEGSESIRRSFIALDDALLGLGVDPLPEPSRDSGNTPVPTTKRELRQRELDLCRDAIKCLVRFFGLTTKRDPRSIIKSSTYTITRKEPRLTPSRG